MMIACKDGHGEIVETILNDLHVQSLSDKSKVQDKAQLLPKKIYKEQTEEIYKEQTEDQNDVLELPNQENSAGQKMNCLELAICYGHR